MLSTLLSLTLLLQAVTIGAQNVTLSSDCSCGFQDTKTQEVFTDSIILYFNETQSVDQHIFEVRNYRNKNQRGWSSIFRQGANPANIQFGNNATWQWQDDLNLTQPSMQMILDPERFDHLSVGAELRSMRRDIQYGTFRSSMRSAQPWVGGSAVSMFMKYNVSQDVEIDLLNMNNASLARVMQTINGEYPNYGIAVNYTDIENGTAPGFPPRSPWDFMELQFDWNETTVDFFVNGNNSRHVTKKDRSIPTTPGTFYFSHWSTGDVHWMMGPPPNGSYGSVKWVRAFFNSSLMTAADHRKYDQNCVMATYCSVDDITLRGSTEYNRAATVPWKYKAVHRGLRNVAGYVAAVFTFFGVAAIINAIIRRGPWYKLKSKGVPGTKRHSTNALRQSLRESIGANMASNFARPLSNPAMYMSLGSATASGYQTPAPGYTSRGDVPPPFPYSHSSNGDLGTMTPLPAYESGTHTPARSIKSMNSRWTPGHARNPSNPPRPRTIRGPLDPTLLAPPQESGAYVLHEEPDEDNVDPRARPYMDLASAGGRRRSSASSSSDSPRNRAYRELTGEAGELDEYYDAEEDRDEIRPLEPARASSPWQFPRAGVPWEENWQRGAERPKSFMDLDEKAPSRNPSAKSQRSQKSDKRAKAKSIEVPEAPQDMSVGKIMHEKTGVPDALTGGATEDPAKEQLPGAPKVLTHQVPSQPAVRIDYLAGLVAFSCIMVTFRHFCLTFWPYIIAAQGDIMHFHADKVLAYILGPWILTPLWIGPFFVTSCRFLAQRYLKTSKFEDIGNKMLLRAPRMLIPVFIFMTIEYFLLSLGLTGRLEWLPSVSFSTWPYVVPQGNFGIFLNQMVELAYIIPNAAPEVINNYCVGVLWTIPVQLQFSFVVLLATVLIKDIKKPWKRMTFYLFSIAMGWYGSSWSACHWLGLMLADVDITYDWRRKIQARWWLLYPILTFAVLLTLATPLVLLFNSAFYNWSFMSWDNAIHGDPFTGRPIFETIPSIWYAYPDYFAPTFAHLTFSLGLQTIVELSVWAQKALSIKLITFFHPHIMTLYCKFFHFLTELR